MKTTFQEGLSNNDVQKRFGGTGWIEENWKIGSINVPSAKPLPLAPFGDLVSEGETQAGDK